MKLRFNVLLFVAAGFLLLFASGNILAQAPYDTLTIHDLQFVPDPATNDQSPYFGDTVVVKGLVMTRPRDLWVGARWSTYVVDPDSFPNPWSGFFIIQHDTFAINTGFQFADTGYIGYFTGVVDEFEQFSQLALLTNPAVPVNFISTGNPLPAPKLLTAADLNQADGEQWEGMWVRLQDMTVVNNNINGDWASITDATAATTYLGSYFNWFNDRIPTQYQWPSNGTVLNVVGFTQDDIGTPGQVFIVNPRDTLDLEITGDPPPVISSVSRVPGAPSSSDNVVVVGTIIDNGSVASASVKYSVNEGPFQSVGMTNVGDVYTGTIPSQSDGDFVRYIIYAEDNLGGGITQPPDTTYASGGVYFYTVRDGALRIEDVQSTHGYALDNSGYEGYTVTLQGVINTDSTDFVGDYYIADAAAMWSGIWINDDPNAYNKGDEVMVTGAIEENFNVTRLNATSSSLVTAGVGEFPPVDVTTGEVRTGGVNAEAYEGVLIRVQNLVVTNPFPDAPSNFGEFTVDDGSGGVRVDDLSSAFRGNLDSTYALNDIIQQMIALGYFSFGNRKLIPRDSSDVIGHSTGIDDDRLEVPTDFALSQNYPNPFNPVTEMEYSIATPGNYSVNIYNILGQKIKTLVSSNHAIGNYTVQWNGTDDNQQLVGSGIYFYSLKGKDLNLTRKMILLK